MSCRSAILASVFVLGFLAGCADPEPDEIDLAEQGEVDECDEVATSPPLPGDACETPGISCGFADECSSCTYRCNGGEWSRTCIDECDGTGGGGE